MIFQTARCYVPATPLLLDANGQTVSAQYGPIGTTVNGVPQTVAYQMRLNPTFNGNIANGNYQAVNTTLSDYNANLPNPTGQFEPRCRRHEYALHPGCARLRRS